MPEIKQSFLQGKMNKDLDERIVPKGEYRDALNVEVSTSDSNNVGTIQSVAGNQQFSSIPGLHHEFTNLGRGTACVGTVTDDKNDKIYWLINSESLSSRPVGEEVRNIWHDKDIIAEYDVKDNTVNPVLVDIYQVWVSLNANNVNTAPISNTLTVANDMIGLLPGMTAEGLNSSNQIIYSSTVQSMGLNSIVFEDNISAFTFEGANYNFFDLHSFRFKNDFGRVLKFNKSNIITGINILDDMLLWTDNESEPKKINITRSKRGSSSFNAHTKLTVTNQLSATGELIESLLNNNSSLIQEDHITVIRKYPLAAPVLEMRNTVREGNIIVSIMNHIDENVIPTAEVCPIGINPQIGESFNFDWDGGNALITEDLAHDFIVGDVVKLSTLVNNILVEGRLRITDIDRDSINLKYANETPRDVIYISCDLLSISGNISPNDINWTMELEQEDAMFEFKFPRFAYRYKYEDGEYSAISPFSEVAFLPEGGDFDYLPKKGYNLSMVNNVRHLAIKDFVLGDSLQGDSIDPTNKTSLPTDVASIDILYKESNSTNIYTVKTIKRKHDEFNAISPLHNNTSRTRGYLNITSEMIHNVLPANQLLRPWDNVPRKALAQEISGNRLIYANYLQGYNVDVEGSVLRANVSSLPIFDRVYPEQETVDNVYGYYPAKSLKSLRTYQVGVVYRDKYGRETPVLTGNKVDSSVTLDKYYSDKQSKLKVQTVGDLPAWVDSYKFFIKETSNEYYNVAMDRWYDAEDGNVWISFPSSERNKIDEDSYLVLKKKHDEDAVVIEAPAKYKVISIKNDAPDFIKLKTKTSGIATESVNGDVLGAGNHLYFPLTQRRVFRLLGEGTGVGSIMTKYTEKSIDNVFVRFRKGNVLTQWYEVTAMAEVDNSGGSAGDLEVQIKTPLTSDINILTSGGVDSSDKYDKRYKSADVKVEFSEKHAQNRPEFDGRFFVKIHRDSVLIKNILTEPNIDFAEDTSYHISHAHEVHYIDAKTPWAKGVYGPDNVVTLPGGATVPIPGTYAAAPTDEWWGFGVDPGDINHYSLDLEYQDVFGWTNSLNPGWNEFLGGKEFWANFGYENWVANGKKNNGMFIDGNSAFQYHRHPLANELLYGWGLDKFGEALAGRWFKSGDNPFVPSNMRQTVIAPVVDHVYSGVSLNPGSGTGAGENRSSPWTQDSNTGEYIYKPHTYPHNLFGINTDQNWPQTHGLINTPFDAYDSGAGAVSIGFKDTSYKSDKESIGIEGKMVHLSWSGIKTEDATGGGAGKNLHIRKNSGAYQDQINFWDALLEQGALWRWEEDPDQRIYETTNYTGSGFQPLFNTAFWNNYNDQNTGYKEGNNDVYAYFPENLLTLDADEEWNKRNRIHVWCVDHLTKGPVGEGPSRYKPTNDPTYPAHFDKDGVILDPLPTDPTTGETLPAPGIRSDGVGSGVEIEAAGSTHTVPSGGLRQHASTVDPNFTYANDFIPGSVTWQIIKPISEQEDIKYASHNPAIFETEPKEDIGLDIYYEIGQIYPVELNERTSEIYIPIGSKVTVWRPENLWNNFPQIVTHWVDIGDVRVKEFDYTKSPIQDTIKIVLEDANGNLITSMSPSGNILPGDHLTFTRPDGSSTEAVAYWETWQDTAPNFFQTTFTSLLATGKYMLDIDVSARPQKLPWFNCYSFGNGVESDRIRDDFNAVTIDNGPKASSINEGLYEEERKTSSLIYSDLYNSDTGVNNLNQFIQAEKITKDLNPVYGSIQKLHTRDTNLVTLCEDKCLKILVDKSALFNADGNPQLLATKGVLGQTIPFSGEFGISKNPESFAAKGFRAYFIDRNRGVVLRLSKDGLTVISEYGMKDWFADNLVNNNKLIGSYNSKKSLYNITLHDSAKTVSFSEKVKGWPSFKSFIPEQGISINNDYYTFKNGDIWKHHIINSTGYPNKINNFYDNQYTSSVEFLLNSSPEIVKNFNTLNYEGSESRITQDWSDPDYYNNTTREGWYVEKIETDLQSGNALEFKNKEGKWFSEIKGETTTLQNLDTEEFSVQGIGNCSTVTVQPSDACMTPIVTLNVVSDVAIDPLTGAVILGVIELGADVYPPSTCTGMTLELFSIDSNNVSTPFDQVLSIIGNTFPTQNIGPLFPAGNYSLIVTDCDGCNITTYFSIIHDGTTVGCTDSSALNYDPNAVYDDGSCVSCVWGCMNSWAFSGYNPLATCNCPEAVPGSNDGNGQIPNTTTLCTSCVYSSFGCTDPNANNYNPVATVDDGSCTYDNTYTCIRDICYISPNGTGYWSLSNYISSVHANPGETCTAYCFCDNSLGDDVSSWQGGTGYMVDTINFDTGSCAAPNNDGAINGLVDLTGYINAIEGYSRWKVQLWDNAEMSNLLAETPYGGTGQTPPQNGWAVGYTVPLTGSFVFDNLSPCNSYQLRLVIENTEDVTTANVNLMCTHTMGDLSRIDAIIGANTDCGSCGATDGPQTGPTVSPPSCYNTIYVQNGSMTFGQYNPLPPFSSSYNFVTGVAQSWYSDPDPGLYVNNFSGLASISVPGAWVINWDNFVNSGEVNQTNYGVSGWNTVTGAGPNAHGTYDLGHATMNGPLAAYHITNNNGSPPTGYLMYDLPCRMQPGETYFLQIPTLTAWVKEYTDDLYWVVGYDASGSEIIMSGGFGGGSGIGDPLEQATITGSLYHRAIVTMPPVLNDENGNPGMDRLRIKADGMFGGIMVPILLRCPDNAPGGASSYQDCTSCFDCA